jgi:hypothetical protein
MALKFMRISGNLVEVSGTYKRTALDRIAALRPSQMRPLKIANTDVLSIFAEHLTRWTLHSIQRMVNGSS